MTTRQVSPALAALTPEQIRVFVATIIARRQARTYLCNRPVFSRYVAALVTTDCESCGGMGDHGWDEVGCVYACYACGMTGKRTLPRGQVQREAALQRGAYNERDQSTWYEECRRAYAYPEEDDDHSIDSTGRFDPEVRAARQQAALDAHKSRPLDYRPGWYERYTEPADGFGDLPF